MAVYSHLPKWLRGHIVLGEFRPFTHEERQARIRDFKAGVKTLRRFYREGFRPADGFDLTDPKLIHSSRIAKAQKAMRELRSQLQFPHRVVRRPQADDSLRALRKHTAQKIPRAQRLVPVHVQVPEKTKVKVRRGRVKIEREIPEGKVIEEFVYLPRRMRSFDEIADWFEDVSPQLSSGLYTLIVARQGQVAEAIDKRLWPRKLREYWTIYDERDAERDYLPAFASTVAGFRYVGDTLQKALQESRIHRSEREIARDRAVQIRRGERSGRLTGRRGRIK